MTSATRERILKAASALLERSGAGFTYDALASEACVSRQTLYTHFPSRAGLLVAVADHARHQLDADLLSGPIFDASTGPEALAALVAFHVAFTPRILNAYRAVELERVADPAIGQAFDQRTAGRRQLVRHVMTRLSAEGCLDPLWTVDTAADFVAAASNASITHELLEIRSWTVAELHDRLLIVLQRSLLDPAYQPSQGGPIR